MPKAHPAPDRVRDGNVAAGVVDVDRNQRLGIVAVVINRLSTIFRVGERGINHRPDQAGRGLGWHVEIHHIDGGFFRLSIGRLGDVAAKERAVFGIGQV